MRERRIFCNPNETYSWKVPNGVSEVFAFVIGGGGGGAHRNWSSDGDDTGGGGGGGGGYAQGRVLVTPDDTHTITVGRGGKGEAGSVVSASAGGTSSFASFLTGNGGPAGDEPSYSSSNQGSTTYGQGGSASYGSGVTEHYTAAGGGKSIGYSTHSSATGASSGAASGVNGAGGGGSSGSPFSKGCGKCASTRYAAIGGAGWGTGQYKDDNGRFYNSWHSGNCHGGGATGGDGSHNMAGIYLTSNNFASRQTNNTPGGDGMTARGGHVGSGGFTAGASTNGSSIAGIRDINGESLPWWFPWEIDGGGGGGDAHSYTSGENNMYAEGGKGGAGAGGGGAACNRSDNQRQAAYGGNGGFGGGGGGAFGYTTSNDNQDGPALVGGNGGIGGGGGGTSCYYRAKNRTYYGFQAGSGGNGIVVLYW